MNNSSTGKQWNCRTFALRDAGRTLGRNPGSKIAPGPEPPLHRLAGAVCQAPSVEQSICQDGVRALGHTPPLSKAAFRGSWCLRGRNYRLQMMLCYRLHRDRCTVGLVKSHPGLQGSGGVCAGGSIAASPGSGIFPQSLARPGGSISCAKTTSPARAGRCRNGSGDAAETSAYCRRGPRKQPPPPKNTPFFAGAGNTTPLLLKT